MGHRVGPYLSLNERRSPSIMMNFITISYLFNCNFEFIRYDFWIYPLGFYVDAYK